MALTYFLDGNNDPVATGDSYVEIQMIDDYFTGGGCAPWNAMILTDKEDYLKALTRRIDNDYIFYGVKVDTTTPQPLQFPRTIGGDPDNYGIEPQKKMLLRYIAAMIEYEIVKLPIGIFTQSQGRQSVTARQQTVPRESLSAIHRFRK